MIKIRPEADKAAVENLTRAEGGGFVNLKIWEDILNLTERFSEGETKTRFEDASAYLENLINTCPPEDFLDVLKEIGTIPERIEHDSTEEKLFSKISDAALCRAFREIGLRADVLKTRGDSADVSAYSPVYGYTLVADAKAFRMSRTAKNQKDFKIVALSNWRYGADFAVLCAPYFQYPSQNSQIYAQALENNVCLFSWEYLIFLIERRIYENNALNLRYLWNFSAEYANRILYSERKRCLIPDLNIFLETLINAPADALSNSLRQRISELAERGEYEISYWLNEIQKIKSYSREEAIQELLEARKIHQKIARIEDCIKGLRRNE